jgi:hypothetical protein
LSPIKELLYINIYPPAMNAGLCDSHNPAHSFCLSVEFRMAKKPPDVFSNLVFSDIQVNYTILSVSHLSLVKINVSSEECWAT